MIVNVFISTFWMSIMIVMCFFPIIDAIKFNQTVTQKLTPNIMSYIYEKN